MSIACEQMLICRTNWGGEASVKLIKLQEELIQFFKLYMNKYNLRTIISSHKVKYNPAVLVEPSDSLTETLQWLEIHPTGMFLNRLSQSGQKEQNKYLTETGLTAWESDMKVYSEKQD